MCEDKLRSEDAEVCTQRLICLEKAILSNPELMVGIGTRVQFRSKDMAAAVFDMAKAMYNSNVNFAKTK